MGALWLFAFRGSAFAAACLSIKPQLGFLILPQLMKDRWFFLRALLVFCGLVATSALVVGYWPDFISRAFLHARATYNNNYIIWYRVAVTPLIGYGILGWALYAVGAIYFLAKNYNVWTAATATFLISPYGFQYDLPVVCLGLAILIFEQWDAMAPWQRLTCCCGFLSPVIVLGGTWLVPPILLASLSVQASMSQREQHGSTVHLTISKATAG
jgi:hypothetical protein